MPDAPATDAAPVPAGPAHRALGALAFLVAALAFLPVGRLLHYATLGASERLGDFAWLAPAVVVGAFLHEALFRGAVYGALRRFLAPGFAAPCVAILGAVGLAALRVWALPAPRVSIAVIAGQAFAVEAALGFALALLALASGSFVPCGAALAALWLVRLGLHVGFRGGVVPVLEFFASLAAVAAVAAVMSRPLEPHREAALGA